MTTVAIKAFVHEQRDYRGAPSYTLFGADMSSHEWAGLCVGPVEIEYTIPEDFNPVAIETAALERRKSEALAAYQSTVAEINERLMRLQAIANDVTEAA